MSFHHIKVDLGEPFRNLAQDKVWRFFDPKSVVKIANKDLPCKEVGPKESDDPEKREPDITEDEVRQLMGSTIIVIHVDDLLYIIDPAEDNIRYFNQDGTTDSDSWGLYHEYGICTFCPDPSNSILHSFVANPSWMDIQQMGFGDILKNYVMENLEFTD